MNRRLLLAGGSLAAVLSGPAGAQPSPLASRFGPSPGGAKNWLRNSTMLGTVAGSPGTMPTNWILAGASGATIIGNGSEGGLPYIEIQMTPTGAGTFFIQFESGTFVVATPGQAWAGSVYCRMTAGSLTSVSVNHLVYSNNAGGGNIANSGAGVVPTAAALATQRSTVVYASTPATTAFITMQIQVAFSAAGSITLRLGAPQLELGSIIHAWVATAGVAASAGASAIGYLP